MDSDEDNKAKRRKSNQEEEEQQQQPTNSLDSLPHEVALDIISRLQIKSLIQSRFVCKFWQQLSYDPHLVSLHLSKVFNSNNPYFIFHSDVPIKNQLYFVEFFNEKVRKIDVPFSASMPEFNVIGSCNGILCLENSMFEETLYLYNPFTQDYTELPKSTIFQDQIVTYGFGFHPVTNQYKLIKIVYYPCTPDVNTITPPYRRRLVQRNLKSDVQIYSVSSNRWRSLGKMPYQLQRRSTGVLLNGRLHWTTTYGFINRRPDRLIVSFDISDEVFREVPGPELLHRMSRQNYHLAVLGEQLCVAVPLASACGTFDLWIMKEYDRKESWVKEIRIGVYTAPTLRTQGFQRCYGIWRNVLVGKIVRVLCLLSNGEILLEYKGGALVSYNPKTGMFWDVTFPGLPNPSKTFLHLGTLNRVDAPSIPW